MIGKGDALEPSDKGKKSALAGDAALVIFSRVHRISDGARRVGMDMEAAQWPPRVVRDIVPSLPQQPDSPHPRQQPSLELERRARKQRLAAGYRLFSHFKFDMGGAGHITARDPELTDHFWVNPLGIHFSKITVSDLMLVDHAGKIVQPPANGPARLNGAAFAIHSRLHAARPSIIAAAHSHSLHGKAFSTLGKLLSPITQDAAAFYEDHALLDRFTGVVFDVEEGDRIAETLGSRHAIILQNHGLLTVGDTVESCLWRYLAMDNACQVQLLADAAGQPKCMPHEVAQLTQRQVGSESAMWGGFQPYWEWITSREPDLLD